MANWLPEKPSTSGSTTQHSIIREEKCTFQKSSTAFWEWTDLLMGQSKWHSDHPYRYTHLTIPSNRFSTALFGKLCNLTLTSTLLLVKNHSNLVSQQVSSSKVPMMRMKTVYSFSKLV